MIRRKAHSPREQSRRMAFLIQNSAAEKKNTHTVRELSLLTLVYITYCPQSFTILSSEAQYKGRCTRGLSLLRAKACDIYMLRCWWERTSEGVYRVHARESERKKGDEANDEIKASVPWMVDERERKRVRRRRRDVSRFLKVKSLSSAISTPVSLPLPRTRSRGALSPRRVH